ncbi:MAG: hypothetical protein IIZ80_08215 [Erysipelotrichaceae bacterium]|nr:hypothetical protein [Erysipelotrichaceae bacterium]
MDKRKQSKRKTIIILMFIIILIMIMFISYLLIRGDGSNIFISDKEVSENQSEINLDIDHHKEEGYTEVMGFGCLDIDKDYPFIYLINPEDNEVYLSFDVYKDEDMLYSSDLIEPGMMEEFNIYECLNAGKHTLTYSIASYDMKNKALLWSGIKQKQEISITK